MSNDILTDRGWNPEDSPIEFDRNRDDSQIVLIKEDMEIYIKYFNKEGYALVKE